MNAKLSSYTPMPLSSVQKGAIGQFTFFATALATGGGEVEIYAPVADNEGRDAELRRHLKSVPGISVQVKITLSLSKYGGGRSEYLKILFSKRHGRVQRDPRLWYFFAVYETAELGFHDPEYLIPADVFHKIGRDGKPSKGLQWYAITANLGPKSRDKWSRYRVWRKDLGKRLLSIIDDAPLTATGGLPHLPADGVWLSRRAIPRGKKSLRTAVRGRKYNLIRTAVLGRGSLSAWYGGHLRVFSPFVLGTKAGDPHVLGYQFDGTSHEPLGPEGSPRNWRCFRVAELTKVTALPGTWHAAGRGKGFQHCIDQVDVSAGRPSSATRRLKRAA
jgi:hypothetical protein